MTAATWASGAALGAVICWALTEPWRRRDPADYVSDEWLMEHRSAGLRGGVDGPCWSWPVRKLENEAAVRDRLRALRGGRAA